MAKCECLGGCPFFNDKMQNKPVMANMYKNKYCLGDSKECARHIIFETLGKTHVPVNLYPNNMERAQSIIAAAK